MTSINRRSLYVPHFRPYITSIDVHGIAFPKDGSLCYFSIKENKRLVLLDGIKMAGAKARPDMGASKKNRVPLDVVFGAI